MARAPMYTFETVDGSIDPVVVKRGTAGPKVLNRGGGWEVVQRARRKGMTQWVGAEPARMSVSVLFDGYMRRQSQEIAISRLQRMSLPPAINTEPPQVRVRPGLPIVGLIWVIQGIEWGDVQIWDRDSEGALARMRQDAVVTLLEYVPPQVIKSNPDAPAGPGQTTQQSGLLTVRDGDSLTTIAARVYGDRSKWLHLADINDIRDPNSLVSGQVIRLV